MGGSKIFKHEIVYNVPLIIYWSNTKILNQIYFTCVLYLCTLYINCSVLAGPLGIIQLCCHLWRRCPQARTESCSVPLWQPPPNADYWVWHLVLAIGFINTILVGSRTQGSCMPVKNDASCTTAICLEVTFNASYWICSVCMWQCVDVGRWRKAGLDATTIAELLFMVAELPDCVPQNILNVTAHQFCFNV